MLTVKRTLTVSHTTIRAKEGIDRIYSCGIIAIKEKHEAQEAKAGK